MFLAKTQTLVNKKPSGSDFWTKKWKRKWYSCGSYEQFGQLYGNLGMFWILNWLVFTRWIIFLTSRFMSAIFEIWTKELKTPKNYQKYQHTWLSYKTALFSLPTQGWKRKQSSYIWKKVNYIVFDKDIASTCSRWIILSVSFPCLHKSDISLACCECPVTDKLRPGSDELE